MERKNTQGITTVMLVLLLPSGHALASFKTCFPGCELGCFFKTDNKVLCFAKCFFKCIVDTNDEEGRNQISNYCNLGCAIDQCAKLDNDNKKAKDYLTNCEEN